MLPYELKGLWEGGCGKANLVLWFEYGDDSWEFCFWKFLSSVFDFLLLLFRAGGGGGGGDERAY